MIVLHPRFYNGINKSPRTPIDRQGLIPSVVGYTCVFSPLHLMAHEPPSYDASLALPTHIDEINVHIKQPAKPR